MPDERWRVIGEEILARDQWITVRKVDYELPDGKRLDSFITIGERDGVNVVAVTDRHEVLLVRQYRAGPDAMTYECPAGYVEEGEDDPLERAKRELREETGYESDDWRSLGVLHSLPNRLRKNDYGFLALNGRKVGGQELDSTEAVRYERFSFEEVEEMLVDGRITNVNAVALLLKARLLMGQRQGPLSAADR